MNTDISWGQQGWICPKCGCVYAPHVDECRRCNGGNNSAIGTGIGTIDSNWEYDSLLDPMKWVYDCSKTGQKPMFEGQPAIITNARHLTECFDNIQTVNEDTINAYFNKE